MIGEFVSAVQRLARQTGEDQFRTSALALLREAIPFGSASWGTTRPDKVGVALCGVQLLGQTEAILHGYAAVRAHDRVGSKTIAHPGQAQILSWRDDYAGAHESFRSYCATFNHFNILSTMSERSLGLQHNFITVARGKASPGFDGSEKARMQQLLPHLLDAWILNRSWHMRTSLPANKPGELVSGICSTSGELLGDNPAFAQLVAGEFPDWAPPMLPPAITAALERDGCWRRDRLLVQTYPVGDVVFLTATVSTEMDKLTAREMTIAREAAEGFSYKEIARSLGLSPATVRAHLHNIYGKLNVSNKTALSRAVLSGTCVVPVGSFAVGPIATLRSRAPAAMLATL